MPPKRPAPSVRAHRLPQVQDGTFEPHSKEGKTVLVMLQLP